MGVDYANNTAIPITEVGEDDSVAVVCHANLTVGKWTYPNGSNVLDQKANSIFVNRDLMVVRLHRRHNATSPTGQYCCTAVMEVNICITLSKFPQSGLNYYRPETTLQCDMTMILIFMHA